MFRSFDPNFENNKIEREEPIGSNLKHNYPRESYGLGQFQKDIEYLKEEVLGTGFVTFEDIANELSRAHGQNRPETVVNDRKLRETMRRAANTEHVHNFSGLYLNPEDLSGEYYKIE